jgi:hypothetical protein
MSRLTITTLRTIIAIALAGSLFVQVVMVPLMWIDLDEAPGAVRVPFVIIAVLGIGTLQVCAVCIWRLLTLVRRESVFSEVAFRYVDVMIGAIIAAAILTFALAVVLVPGEEVPPGIVGLLCGFSLVIVGVALVVVVMRRLLVQATELRTELAEVV